MGHYIISARGSGKSFYTMAKTEELQKNTSEPFHKIETFDEIVSRTNLVNKEMREIMQKVSNTLNAIDQRIVVSHTVGNERAGSHIFVPTIDRIYYNTKKRTVVIYWSTGESTKVTCAAGETFDVELGIRLAVCKYALGNSSTVSKGIIAKAVEKANNTTKE